MGRTAGSGTILFISRVMAAIGHLQTTSATVKMPSSYRLSLPVAG